MAFCQKCGAQFADGMKFCDKCGTPTGQEQYQQQAPAQNQYANQGASQAQYAPQGTQGVNAGYASYSASTPSYGAAPSKGLEDTIKSVIPASLMKPGDKTMYFVGLGSIIALAITYIVCFFVFMSDMCVPIAAGAMSDEGSSSFWMVVYMLFNLFPAVIAGYAVVNKKFRVIAIFAAAFSFVLTIFALISWGICTPSSFLRAGNYYLGKVDPEYGTFSWYILMDCLSEAWYLKLILPLGTIFGFGVDYIANKAK